MRSSHSSLSLQTTPNSKNNDREREREISSLAVKFMGLDYQEEENGTDIIFGSTVRCSCYLAAI
jgi:hypothetical protein